MSSSSRYPVYIPSKGRHDFRRALTARFLVRDRFPFRLVVNPEEAEAYESLLDGIDPDRAYAQTLILPQNRGGLIYARNWIKDHATQEGHDRHWQFDDNIWMVMRVYRGKRIPCATGLALTVCEDFTDRYENIGISGLNYDTFVRPHGSPPFRVNCHVYSASLISNRLPFGWRLVYNDDTDFCLRVLAKGLCTVQFNAFMVKKVQTMIIRGGNTDDLYQGDGRLRMARTLERQWPGIVHVDRRWRRPQHVIDWRRFRTELVPKPDAPQTRDYGFRLVQKRPVRSATLRTWLRDADAP